MWRVALPPLNQNPKFSKSLAIALMALLVVLGVWVIFRSRAATIQPPKLAANADLELVKKNGLQMLQLVREFKAKKLPGDPASQIATLALQRKDSFIKLINNDPAAARRVAFDAKRKALLPAVATQIEEVKDISGIFQAVHGETQDAKDKAKLVASPYRFWLVDPKTKIRTNLHLTRTPNLKSGSKVTFKSAAIQGTDAAASGEPSGYTVQSVPADPPVRQRKVAVVLGKFTGMDAPYTADDVMQKIFLSSENSVAHYFSANSFGKQAVVGQVFGWYDIGAPEVGCDNWYDWGQRTEAAAAAAGVDLSGYDQVLHITGMNCWFGWGSVRYRDAWVNVGLDRLMPVAGHELGHTFGSAHANSWMCQSGSTWLSITGNCSNFEYGDLYDIMGLNIYGATIHHANNYHKLQWEMFDPGNVATVGAGTYTITPQESASSGTQVLRAFRNHDDIYNTDEFYYLEYRQPTASETFSPDYEDADKGVSLRIAADQTDYYNGSELIDLSPDGNFRKIALLPRQTFTDPNYPFSFTVNSVDASGASVTVDTPPPPPCVVTPPSLTISPPSAWAHHGETVSYFLQLTDEDHGVCPPTSFDISGSLPAGFTQTSFPQTLSNMKPGSTAYFTVNVTSPADAADGYYDFTENVKRQNSPEAATSVAASYNVFTPETNPPVVQITAPSNGDSFNAGQVVNITATITDDTAVQGAYLADNGFVPCECGGSLGNNTYSFPWNVQGGDHVLVLHAFDPSGNDGVDQITVKGVDTLAPSKPLNLRTTATATDSITLTWDHASDNSNSVKYQVFRDGALVGETGFYDVSPQGAKKKSGALAGGGGGNSTGAPYYFDFGLAPDTSYSYFIRAIDASGNFTDGDTTSFRTLKDTTPPSQPPNAKATPVGVNHVLFSWDASTDNVGVAGYRLVRDNGQEVLNLPASARSAEVVVPLFGHNYGLNAIDAAGNLSPTFSYFIYIKDSTPPSSPQNLRQTAVSDSSISIAWDRSTDNNPNSGIIYTVYQNGKTVVRTGQNSYTAAGLKASTEYSFYVTAEDDVPNVSAPSDAKTFKTKLICLPFVGCPF